MLTTILTESSWSDNADEDELALFKRNIFGHHHGHKHEHHGDHTQPGGCVRCGFGIISCCPPNICVKRRLRRDKCLRVKG